MTTERAGTVNGSAQLKRKGTYWFRWSFAGTTSYRAAKSGATKVVVK
jgi:hypothetical protein